MFQYLRPRPAWWKVRLFGSDDAQAIWRTAAKRNGHRLFDINDEDGSPVTVVVVYQHAQITELRRLREAIGIDGALEYMP